MYATEQDIIDLYSLQALLDVLKDPDADYSNTLDQALESAASEIDSHLSVRYRLPLEGRPKVLVRPAIDITLYVLASTHTRLTDELTKRYEDAVKHLSKIANGKAGLGKDEPQVTTPEGGSTGGSDFSAKPRKFGRGRGNL